MRISMNSSVQIDSQFDSHEILSEVRWRLEVLHNLAIQQGMEPL